MAEKHLKHFAEIKFFRKFTKIKANLGVHQTQHAFFIGTDM
jgi:hypothetical protein